MKDRICARNWRFLGIIGVGAGVLAAVSGFPCSTALADPIKDINAFHNKYKQYSNSPDSVIHTKNCQIKVTTSRGYDSIDVKNIGDIEIYTSSLSTVLALSCEGEAKCVTQKSDNDKPYLTYKLYIEDIQSRKYNASIDDFKTAAASFYELIGKCGKSTKITLEQETRPGSGNFKKSQLSIAAGTRAGSFEYHPDTPKNDGSVIRYSASCNEGGSAWVNKEKDKDVYCWGGNVPGVKWGCENGISVPSAMKKGCGG